MPEYTDTQAIIEVAEKAAETEVLPIGGTPLVALVHADTRTVAWTDLDDYKPNPRRHQGVARFRSPDSFIAYLHQLGVHNGEWEQVGYYADERQLQVTAVLNDDGGLPGHRDYRAELVYELTDEWRAWQGINGQFFRAQVFAEFVEDWRHTIVDPDAGSIIDLVRAFKATQKVTYKDEISDRNGDRALTYVKETTAGTTTGSLDLPERFVLEMVPFIGGTEVLIEARFRYRLDDGGATFGVALAQPALILRNAFEAELESLGNLLPEGTPIMLGSPAR